MRRQFSVVAKIRRTSKNAYTSNWNEIAQKVKQRDGNACRECGYKGPGLTVHHVIPVSRGGQTIMFNLITLCPRCHSSKPFHKHMR